jgi:anti-sigma regulatory factor (Ser/Thr protein kinase)
VDYVDLVYLAASAGDAGDLAALARGELAGYERELRLIRSDGDIRWARVRVTLLPPVQRTQEAVVIRFVEDLTAERRTAQQHQAIEDSVKHAYSEVIAAVTGDRLLVLREDELRSRLGRVISPAQRLTEPQQLPQARAVVRSVLRNEFPGLAGADQLLLAASEALTNALKHAGGGTLEIRKMDGRVQIVICDEGSGIDFATLPRATLVSGYSTMNASLGVGFTIMLEVCDSVLLSTGPQGTTVVLQADQDGTAHSESANETA